MDKYQFKTRVNVTNKGYWHDNINPIVLEAQNLKEALKLYIEAVTERDYLTFSKSALNTKKPIYYDNILTNKSIQSGYCINARTEIENKKVNLNLWVDIRKLINPFNEVTTWKSIN
jgi:hypothetical protein